MKRLYFVLSSVFFIAGAVSASETFDAASYEIMQDCLADAEGISGSADYIQYCIDSYLSTQQIVGK